MFFIENVKFFVGKGKWGKCKKMSGDYVNMYDHNISFIVHPNSITFYGLVSKPIKRSFFLKIVLSFFVNCYSASSF